MSLTILPNLNNVPKELLDEIPPLEYGQIAVFKSLVTVNNFDAERSIFEGVSYPTLHISTRDIIRWKDEAGKLHRIPIGVPKTIEDDKVTEFKFFAPGLGMKFGGRFTLTGGIADDEEMYYFLMLSNQRDNNAHRDNSVEPLYEFIDFKAEAKTTRRLNNKLRIALNLIDNMTDGECTDFAASMNWSLQTDPEILKADIENYAKENTENFLLNFTNKGQLEMKSFIKKAEEKQLIMYEPTKSRVIWVKGKVVIATLEKEDGKDWLDQFADWCKTAGNGNAVYRSIKKMVTNEKE